LLFISLWRVARISWRGGNVLGLLRVGLWRNWLHLWFECVRWIRILLNRGLMRRIIIYRIGRIVLNHDIVRLNRNFQGITAEVTYPVRVWKVDRLWRKIIVGALIWHGRTGGERKGRVQVRPGRNNYIGNPSPTVARMRIAHASLLVFTVARRVYSQK